MDLGPALDSQYKDTSCASQRLNAPPAGARSSTIAEGRGGGTGCPRPCRREGTPVAHRHVWTGGGNRRHIHRSATAGPPRTLRLTVNLLCLRDFALLLSTLGKGLAGAPAGNGTAFGGDPGSLALISRACCFRRPVKGGP